MDRIKYLLLRFLREEATPAEQAELQAWAGENPAHRELIEEMQDPAKVAEGLAILDSLHRAEAWGRVEAYAAAARESAAPNPFERRRLPWIRYAVAAALIGGLGWGSIVLYQRQHASTRVKAFTTAPVADIAAPATNRARITLAGGQQIYLDSADKGALAQQGNAQVVKEASGQVAYKVENITSSALIYNTLTNPRGSRVVTLTLSDGTKVWLNAESSLRYPVIFTGGDRAVEISGEGYFEVAKNANKPFKVQITGRGEVDVLGTSFNIKAYEDENTGATTTLLEGSIRVRAAALTGVPSSLGSEKLSLILKPGEQAQVLSGSLGAKEIEKLKNVDTAAVMAWKNGRFAFHHADLQTVMRELARWYDLNVHYEGNFPNMHFSGRIGSDLTLNQVLRILAGSHVHYQIEKNEKDKVTKLIIRP